MADEKRPPEMEAAERELIAIAHQIRDIAKSIDPECEMFHLAIGDIGNGMQHLSCSTSHENASDGKLYFWHCLDDERESGVTHHVYD